MAIEVGCGGEGSGLGPWMRQVCRSRCLPSAKGTTGMHPLPQGLGLGKASLRPPRPCTENAEPGALATCLLPARGPGLGVCKAGVRWHSLLCSQLRGGIFLQSRWQEREEESIVLWGRKPGEGRGAGGRGSAVGLGDSRPPRRGRTRTKPPFPVTDSASALSSHIALGGGVALVSRQGGTLSLTSSREHHGGKEPGEHFIHWGALYPRKTTFRDRMLGTVSRPTEPCARRAAIPEADVFAHERDPETAAGCRGSASSGAPCGPRLAGPARCPAALPGGAGLKPSATRLQGPRPFCWVITPPEHV